MNTCYIFFKCISIYLDKMRKWSYLSRRMVRPNTNKRIMETRISRIFKKIRASVFNRFVKKNGSRLSESFVQSNQSQMGENPEPFVRVILRESFSSAIFFLFVGFLIGNLFGTFLITIRIFFPLGWVYCSISSFFY